MTQQASAPVVLVIGTRPEGIKLLPVYFAFKQANIPVCICSTLQHTELLTEVFELFGVEPDVSLDIMRPGQDLFYVTQAVLQKTKELFAQLNPPLVVVQGDTTSGMAAGLAAFYLKIPLVHVEAGLRTDDLHAPFPEEMNRRVLRVFAQYHFAPTSWAAAQLLAEGVDKQRVFCVGNTVVDALRIIKNKMVHHELEVHEILVQKIASLRTQNKKIMLLTMHRRESFDGGVQRVLTTLYSWLKEHPEVLCFYPYHPNPHIVQSLHASGFAQLDNVQLFEPLAYTELVYVLDHADYVVTDSGGIQEEVVSLGKSVIVLREKTERVEAVWAGAAQLVGTDAEKIIAALNQLSSYKSQGGCVAQLFGDGFAAEKTVHILRDRLGLRSTTNSENVLVSQGIKKRDIGMNQITVIGLGYIGLPTSIVLAEAGYHVSGVDVDAQKVAAINAGDPVIKEPELFEKLQSALGAQTFKASVDIKSADYFIIAVPTPITDKKEADLSYVYTAIDAVVPVLKRGDTIILESTVPVGTTQMIADHIATQTNLLAGTDFFVAHCPERVLPGNIFYELVHNTRIIGGINKASVEKAKKLYASFVVGELYLTDSKTAELIKLVENSSRDAQIAFAHQVASMATSIGLDPYEVIELANKHPRVNILRPTCGVGGHCLAVDPWFLSKTFGEHARYIAMARQVNDARPREIVTHIEAVITDWQKQYGKKPTIALCGMTYKPDVDDLRESPAVRIVQLLEQYAPIVCEPHVAKELLHQKMNNQIAKFTDAIARADIIVFLVAHTRFKTIDRAALQGKKVLDFCGLMHEPKPKHNAQEYYFWPASAVGSINTEQAT